MLDFHSHLMPGVDDGAADVAEARVGLATLQAQGVREIITTPHMQASLVTRPDALERYMAALDEAWATLVALARSEFPELRLERGVEVALDIPHPRLDDPRLRLAGTSFALVEFPFMSIPPNTTLAVRELVREGVRPVIAHPERYSNMSANVDLVESWRDAGALIQLNAGSLLGIYGTKAERLAWQFLSEGLADYLSSDYHSRGKCSLAGAAEMLREKGGEAQHNALTTVNPRRLLADQLPLPVAPLAPVEPPRWRRLIPWH